MPQPIQFKNSLILILLLGFTSNVFAQTIKTYIDNQWQDSRYTDNGDETVTDNKTHLMWKKCTEGLTDTTCTTGAAATHTWKAALELASTTTFATYNDWRLPNIKELASLAAHDRYNPAINSTIFPNTPSSGFWSSSPYANDSSNAWILNFDSGYDGYSIRSYSYYVRLVRGGQ